MNDKNKIVLPEDHDELIDKQDNINLTEQTGVGAANTKNTTGTWDEKPKLNIYYDEVED